MKFKLTRWILIFLGIILSVNLVRVFLNLSNRGDIIGKTQDRLQKAKDENEELKRELAGVQSNDYIEKQAREKLNLGREGEITVLLPTITPIELPTPTPFDDSANWEKWLRLFF
jgi:cell division protein FtsB